VWPTVNYSSYSEDYLDDLETVYKNNTLPDCSKLPEKLQAPILGCFKYNLKERTSAVQMIDALRSDSQPTITEAAPIPHQ